MECNKSRQFAFLLAVMSFMICTKNNAQKVQILNTRINPVDKAEMVFITAGEFIMGSNPEEIEEIWKKLDWDTAEIQFTKSEQPAHRVQVNGFWMYRNLVTVAQYMAFCKSTGTKIPETPSYGWKDENPVVNVNWHDAKAYCDWAGGRLPYEAEWEYAARGGNTGTGGKPRMIFVWGDSLPVQPLSNLADESFIKSGYYNSPGFHFFSGYDDGFAAASPVRAFPANGYGLFDMAGNVLEWCEDWYGPDYYLTSPAKNPHGPANGDRRVLRGGAFDTTPTITRISKRLGNFPDIRNEEKGFRCICNLPMPEGK